MDECGLDIAIAYEVAVDTECMKANRVKEPEWQRNDMMYDGYAN